MAIATIAGSLERRVFTETSMSKVYANLYVLLVAPPGVGKSVGIFQGRALMDKTKKLKIAPDDVTKASLVDHLAQATQHKVYPATKEKPAGDLQEYASLQITADEFGVLVPAHDSGFLSVMNALYDNREIYKESRRGRDGDLIIANPQVNLLAGTQPDFLANLLPPEAWGMGFMSRMLMVYAGKSAKPKLFGKKLKVDTKDLSADLNIICELHGEVNWSKEAEELLVTWYESGMQPEPEHSKLKHYVPRRILTTIKLCMISAISHGNELMIEEEDVRRAQDWLIEIESLMPDVFKDMSGPGDNEVLKELHYFVSRLHNATRDAEGKNPKPVPRGKIEAFLASKTPAYNIENIYKSAVRAGIIVEGLGDSCTPGHVNSLRVE